MGTLDHPFELKEGMTLNLPGDVVVIADAAEVERLRRTAPRELLGNFKFADLTSGDQLPAADMANAFAAVVQVDPEDRASLRRIAQIRATRPHLPLIVALHDASVPAVRTLVRQGVNDVCALPFDAEELTSQLLDILAQQRASAAAQLPLAPLVAVVRSTGGCGATTVVTHLGAALAANAGLTKRACVIDLDIQFGNVGTSLGRSAKTSVTDLLEAGGRLDAEFLHSATVDSGRGFDLMVAPAAITPLEAVDVDQLLNLLTIARREYGAVLVDLPSNWTNWALSTALAATDIVVITDLTIPGLRQTKRRLELFDSVGLSRDKIRIVVNRVERRLFRAIGVDEVRQTLGHPVFATLAAEPQILAGAQDQGLLAWEANRKSKFAADMSELGARLAKGWEG